MSLCFEYLSKTIKNDFFSFFQAITEEEKRKSIISSLGKMPDETTLTMYIRRPGESAELLSPETNKLRQKFSPLLSRRIPSSASESNEDQSLPPLAPRRNRKTSVEVNVTDRVEIDSDNIETPPATRKLGTVKTGTEDFVVDGKFSRVHPNEHTKVEEEEMGDGQFNRFSSTRRTRRYKKSNEDEPTRRTDVVSPELIPDKQVLKPTTLQVQSYPVASQTPQDTESRLKKWQDRLKYRPNEIQMEEEAIDNIMKSGEELQNLGKSSTLPRSMRNRRSISRTEIFDSVQPLSSNEATSQPKDSSNVAGSFHSLPRSSRHRSNIDQSDVSQAIRKYGNQQDQSAVAFKCKPSKEQQIHDENNSKNDCIKVESNIIKPQTLKNNLESSNNRGNTQIRSEFIQEIRVQASTPKQKSEHEMNDEGFEETQSLVSETPSQGTSSGCNYEGESIELPKSRGKKLTRADSSGSGGSNSEVTRNKISRTSSMKVPDRKGIIPRSSSLRKTDSQASLTRGSVSKKPHFQSSLSRQTSQSSNMSDSRKSLNQSSLLQPDLKKESTVSGNKSSQYRKIVPLEKTQSKVPSSNIILPVSFPSKKRVERSNSKSSLRSSRSSLNSATSVSTVRNIRPVPGIGNYTNVIKSLTSDLRKSTSVKKPLAPVQLKNKTPVPASRSSSSGSSIGPTTRRPQVTAGLSTSFKENNASGVPASRSSSSGSSIGPARRVTNSFMRPTASSAAKDSIDTPRVKPLFRQSIK